MKGFVLKWGEGSLELQAQGLGERVALVLIAGVVLIALAWIFTRRSR